MDKKCRLLMVLALVVVLAGTATAFAQEPTPTPAPASLPAQIREQIEKIGPVGDPGDAGLDKIGSPGIGEQVGAAVTEVHKGLHPTSTPVVGAKKSATGPVCPGGLILLPILGVALAAFRRLS